MYDYKLVLDRIQLFLHHECTTNVLEYKHKYMYILTAIVYRFLLWQYKQMRIQYANELNC